MTLPYNYNIENLAWKDCSLRMWLNGEFIEKYVGGESGRIQITTIDGEVDVADRAFLLSVDEAEKYFQEKTLIQYYIDENGEEKATAWWLRSSGETNLPPYVSENGQIVVENETYAMSTKLGVRPAMWVSLDGLE